MVFQWILTDSKSPKLSRTYLSILANFYKTVVWMVSTCFLIPKSSCPFTNHLVIVPSESITIGITVTLMSHSLFVLILWWGLGTYLSFYFLIFLLCSLPVWQSIQISRLSFLTITRYGRLVEIRGSFCISKFQGICASHSTGWILGYVRTTYLYGQI